jgi:hypothetical protein
MKSVFVLQHMHIFGPGDEDTKMIGVYSTEASALAAVFRIKDQPGFCEHPNVINANDENWSGFHISEYDLDTDHWTEGYITV